MFCRYFQRELKYIAQKYKKCQFGHFFLHPCRKFPALKQAGKHQKILKVIFAITEKIWDSENNERWEHNCN